MRSGNVQLFAQGLAGLRENRRRRTANRDRRARRAAAAQRKLFPSAAVARQQRGRIRATAQRHHQTRGLGRHGSLEHRVQGAAEKLTQPRSIQPSRNAPNPRSRAWRASSSCVTGLLRSSRRFLTMLCFIVSAISLRIAMRPAVGFLQNFIDQPKLVKAFRRAAHRLGGDFFLLGALPQNRCAGFRRNDRIHAELQHDQMVADADGERAARAALADHDAQNWCGQMRHLK